MKGGGAFSRAKMMMAAMATLFEGAVGATALHEAALAAQALGATYKSRGHGGKKAHSFTGIAQVRRARIKARGQLRNKRLHRGRAGA